MSGNRATNGATMKYKFVDQTGKPRQTVGEFVGYTYKTGPKDEQYAIFTTERGDTFVPVSWLTDETTAAIAGVGKMHPIEILG